MAFAIDDFVARCSAAVRKADGPEQIASILREAIADPDAIAEAVRERQEGLSSPPMAEVFVNEEDLTIYHLAFPPHLFGVPHDHAGWAVIGVYKGAEEFNIYAEEEEEDGRLVRLGRQLMQAPSVEILDPDLIHDIENSGTEPCGSIHVYSNRHFDLPGRRIWRDEAANPEQFTVDRSFTYGIQRTNRIRRERGMEDAVMTARPSVSSTNDH